MKWALTVVLGLAVIGAGIFGVHRYRESQLSPAVNAAVVAAVGENASESDIPEFLRAAKLASRTKRDAEVVALFDKAVFLAATMKREGEECHSIGLQSIIEFASAKAHAQIAGFVLENSGDPNKAQDVLVTAEEYVKRGNAEKEQYNKCTEALESKQKQEEELIKNLRAVSKRP